VTRSATRTRRTATDRRRQLIGIGLEFLATRPVHQITIDEVAAVAGISRSLLFHYFPTKQDYFAAVVRAASRRLLRRIAPESDDLGVIVSDYVHYIERRREPYVALFRSPSAGDWVRPIHEDTQDALTSRVLAALPECQYPDKARLVVRAWWSFAEELAINWAGRDDTELIDLLMATLHRVIDAAS
jgi:AcrR family transcriptional regulator